MKMFHLVAKMLQVMMINRLIQWPFESFCITLQQAVLVCFFYPVKLAAGLCKQRGIRSEQNPYQSGLRAEEILRRYATRFTLGASLAHSKPSGWGWGGGEDAVFVYSVYVS